jgi:hypothetical protein
MRAILAILACGILTAGEATPKPTQAEQDAMWQKAMEESAAVEARRRENTDARMAYLDQIEKQRRTEADEAKRAEAQKHKEACERQFLEAHGVPMHSKAKRVGQVTAIPERLRGTLVRQENASTWTVVGSISANVIQAEGHRGYVLDSAELCDDGSIAFIADGTAHTLRWSPKDGGSVVLTTLVDAPLLPAWSYALRK